MKKLRLPVLGLVLAIMALSVIPVFGAPDTQTNLLANAGFEGGKYLHEGNPQYEAPTSWSVWWRYSASGCENQIPTFILNTEGRYVHGGAQSSRYYTEGNISHTAGLWQQASVTDGETYRFTAYAKTVSPTTSPVRVGIDPNGGNDPTAGSIVWSAFQTANDAWMALSVEAVANGTTITVYTYNRVDSCVSRSDTAWDDTSLVQVAAVTNTPVATSTSATTVAPTAVPSATPTPTETPFAYSTPDATGRIVHLVGPGDTLSGIAFMYGVSMDEIKRLNNMTDDIVVLGTYLIIREGGSATEPPTEATPTEEPTEASPTEAPPTEAPTQEQPTEQPTEAVGTGTICVMSWDDTNGNGIREAGEERLAGITFTINNGTTLLDRYTTDGISEPYCFVEMPEGTYTISWTGDSFEATTPQVWTATVTDGAILNQEFGARLLGSGDQTPAEEEGGGIPTWLIAVLGALAVFVVLGGIGMLVYILVLRKQGV
nr:LysM peptidoglycan-binding domain-containing protein [Anaerolineae bacterium]